MAVQYYNGQYYDFSNGLDRYAYANPNDGRQFIPGLGYGKPISAPAPNSASNGNNIPQAGNNPFASASSGGVSGTLQPFVNRNTSLANNALYGGLLGYQPQQLMAGNAGGTPVHPQAPQYNMPSAFPQGLLNFGNRSWMGGQ